MPVNSLPQLKTNFAGLLANDSSNERTGYKITTLSSTNLTEPATANPIDEQLSNSALPSATNPLSEQVHSQQPAWSGSNITELAAIDSSNDLLYNLYTARQNSQDKMLSSQQYASSSTDITEHSASCLWNEQSRSKHLVCQNFELTDTHFCLGEQCPDGKEEVNYRYTEHLVALEACRPQQPYSLPQSCSKITTPLKLDQWELVLRDLPDQPLREYILHRISHGFRVGFDYRNHTTLSVKHNMPSAQTNPDPVEKFLATEVSEGRVIGPLRMEDFPHVQTNRFGVIPKRNQPNKWRLILDLSSPTGTSVNDGISPEMLH